MEDKPNCPRCGAEARLHLKRQNTRIGLKGRKEKLLRRVFYCRECVKFFTENPTRSITYSDDLVKLALSVLRRGQTLELSRTAIFKEAGVHIPTTTLCDWRKKWGGENGLKSICADVRKWGRDEIGADRMEEILQTGTLGQSNTLNDRVEQALADSGKFQKLGQEISGKIREVIHGKDELEPLRRVLRRKK